MNDQPLLLLDIDGCLSPVAEQRGRLLPRGVEWLDLECGWSLPVRFDSRLPAWLARLSSAFELVWATSWQDVANDAVAPFLGLPALPVVWFLGERASVELGSFTAGAKLPAIGAYIGERPAAWIDDGITPTAKRWAVRRDQAHPTLFLKTNPVIGVTERHIGSTPD